MSDITLMLSSRWGLELSNWDGHHRRVNQVQTSFPLHITPPSNAVYFLQVSPTWQAKESLKVQGGASQGQGGMNTALSGSFGKRWEGRHPLACMCACSCPLRRREKSSVSRSRSTLVLSPSFR